MKGETKEIVDLAVNRIFDFVQSDDALKFCDVTLRLDSGVHLRCHRIVLAAHSSLLSQIFKDNSDSGEVGLSISLPEFDPDDLKKFVEFCYRGSEVSLDSPSVRSLIGVGHPLHHEEIRDSGKLVKKRKRKFEEKKLTTKKLKTTIDLKCCDKEFDDKIFYATHKEKVHSERPGDNEYIICCDQKIFDEFKNHLQSTHKLDEDTEKSECCDQIHEDLDDLTKHCADNHGLKVTTFKGILCCATKLDNVEEYQKHKEQDVNHLECSQCWFISKDERQLNLHLYSKHKIGTKPEHKVALTCKFCSKTFSRVQLRLEHEDKHDNKFKYTCMFCKKQFKLLTALRSHLYRLGKNHNQDTNQYDCDTCPESFDTVIAKRKHTRVIHENKDVLSCDSCERSFVDKHSLENHIKVSHLKIKDVQCTHCGKLFATHERMKVHENYTHTVLAEQVPCDLCGKKYSNKQRMIDHRRSVHREKQYQCEECGTVFKNSSTLKSHVVSRHFDPEEKPLKCSVCLKGFLHESRLKAHEVIHKDEAKFSCKFCGRPNKCKNNNKKHENRCKKGKVMEQNADQGSTEHNSDTKME